MPDPTLPQEMQDHINAAGWPGHHARWHYEQRHDYWHHLAAQGNLRNAIRRFLRNRQRIQANVYISSQLVGSGF